MTTSFRILRANPVGLFCANTLVARLTLLQTTLTSYLPADISAYVGTGSPTKDLAFATSFPLIKRVAPSSDWNKNLYRPDSKKLTFFQM